MNRMQPASPLLSLLKGKSEGIHLVRFILFILIQTNNQTNK